MSKYIEAMKKELKAFSATANQFWMTTANNKTRYLSDIADKENAKLKDAFVEEAAAVNTRLDRIHADAREDVRRWATMDATEIDRADLALLTGDFNLSLEDVMQLVEKHQSNGTMINAIEKYAKEHGIALDYLPKAEDRLEAYQTFADSAHRVVGELLSHAPTDGPFDPTDAWGDPENISEHLRLVIYGYAAPKKYADPPAPAQAPFEFKFKPLGGRSTSQA